MNLRIDDFLRVRISQGELGSLKNQGLSQKFQVTKLLSLKVSMEIVSTASSSFVEENSEGLTIFLSPEDSERLLQKEFRKAGVMIDGVNVQVDLMGAKHRK